MMTIKKMAEVDEKWRKSLDIAVNELLSYCGKDLSTFQLLPTSRH